MKRNENFNFSLFLFFERVKRLIIGIFGNFDVLRK